MVTATKAANGNYLVSSSTSTAITINPKGLSISGLTGVNKEFDHGVVGTATGTPTLVGKVGSDDVLLSGTPTFSFGAAAVTNGHTLTASGYTLTGTTAGNYTLTQPTVTANITAKAARVVATNTTVAFGAAVTSGFTTSALISPDAVGSVSYTYTGTGTSTPPTAVGVYTVTPSNAVFSTGSIGNYTVSYDTATVTILAKYTITYNANGGSVASSSTTTADFVVGDTALTLPTSTRANYTFTGWYTLQTNGVQVTGAYTPMATATLWAHWVQNSLYGMGANTKILTITTLFGVGNTYSANAAGGTIAIEYLADALPAGTIIDAYILSDTSTATTLIGAGNDYVMSLVLAWVHPTTGLVETTATGKPITMTITNSAIKKGAKIYSVIGLTPTLLTTATTDGSAVISITDDPQIIIAITKPDAPTGVSATSGGNASTTVSWTAPSDGGSAITGYTATSNAGQTCSSSTTTCSITGLTNGTPYTFTVTATNAIGTSDPSAPSSAATPAAPSAPVVTPPTSGGGGSTYVAPTPEPVPTVDPAVAAAAAARALADAKAAEEKAIADAKALAEKRLAEEAELLAIIKALQDKADADSLAAAKKLADELAAARLKGEEELKAAAALRLAEEQRIAAERSAAAMRVTTVYSTSAAFKLNQTYTKRLNTYTKKIATGSTVTCIGYAKSSKMLTYAKAKVVATKQAKALCSSMKKINPTLKTKSIVYPASKAPVTTVNKKWIPVSYRIESPVN
jgi:titin